MKKIILFSAVLGICVILLPQTSAAATLTVCSSGCNHTTIQAAIDAANPDDTISVLDPLHTEADIVVNKDLTIQGQGEKSTVVQASDTPMTNDDRVFTINSSVSATIQDMTIRHGDASDFEEIDGLVGGGLFNQGTLTLANCSVSDNFSDAAGGGIYNVGTLTATDCTISDNESFAEGGGLANQSGTMELIDCNVYGNYADLAGGGIDNTLGMLTMINSEISGNEADSTGGGGILNAGGDFSLISSTINDNYASSGIGGGIWNDGIATLNNSSVSGNWAFDEGAGILNTDTLTMINCTTSANFGFGLENFGSTTVTSSTLFDGLGYCSGFDTVTVSSSIIGDCGVSEICIGPFEKPIISNGYNIDRDGTCIDNPATGDQIGVDPMLGPLQNNGGPTETHALLPESPAIDAIPVASCTDPDGIPIATDQRGVIRPQGPGCDIGAFEFITPGDLDADGDCDAADFAVFRSSMGICSGEPGFLPEGDYDDDGCISYADYRIWYGHYRNQ